MVTRQELEGVLKPLQAFLDGLPGEDTEPVTKVRTLLSQTFDAAAAQPPEDGRVERALVALAQGAIEAKRNGLPRLPVPEYDLWLPFKAGCGLHSRPTDGETPR